MPVIAVDAMGGDLAPDEIVKGVARASLSTAIECVLVGEERRIQTILESVSYNPEHISIRHASEVVGMAEAPKEALKTKRDASITVGAKLVADGHAQALVSAGNTGACILACARHFRAIRGIQKTALASVYPRQTEYAGQDQLALLLDVGATIRCDAIDLVQFAVMGSAYARIISKNTEPSVALLSNGTEPQKGPPRVVEANAKLSKMGGLRFIGNVEGIDIPKGTADVVVCDGFVGNVCLKMLEGVSETVVELAKYAYKEKLLWRAGLAMLSSGIERIKEVTDWEQYGGAPILGFDRVFIKAHGRSKAKAIFNAGKVAAKAVSHDLGRAIQESLPTA